MSNYYYLTASLPMLAFKEKSPLSIQKFIETCSRLVKREDFLTIRNALLNNSSKTKVSNPTLLKWHKFEYGLRNELVKLRTQGKGLDTLQYLHQEFSNPFLAEKAREIIEAENPFKAEMIFNRMLWDQCDELETGQMFNLAFLIIYHLKLQILERIISFNAEKGRQKVESIVSGELYNE